METNNGDSREIHGCPVVVHETLECHRWTPMEDSRDGASWGPMGYPREIHRRTIGGHEKLIRQLGKTDGRPSTPESPFKINGNAWKTHRRHCATLGTHGSIVDAHADPRRTHRDH